MSTLGKMWEAFWALATSPFVVWLLVIAAGVLGIWLTISDIRRNGKTKAIMYLIVLFAGLVPIVVLDGLLDWSYWAAYPFSLLTMVAGWSAYYRAIIKKWEDES